MGDVGSTELVVGALWAEDRTVQAAIEAVGAAWDTGASTEVASRS